MNLSLQEKYRLNESAEVIGRSEAKWHVGKYISKARLPYMKVQRFRHICISYLLSNNMSYRIIARWIGDTEKVIP